MPAGSSTTFSVTRNVSQDGRSGIRTSRPRANRYTSGRDSFLRKGIRRPDNSPSRGKWWMKGLVYFIPARNPGTNWPGSLTPGAVEEAGELHASTQRPNGLVQIVLHRYAYGRWNGSVHRGEVTPSDGHVAPLATTPTEPNAGDAAMATALRVSNADDIPVATVVDLT